MTDRPLLKLPDPEPYTPRRRGGGGGDVMRPPRDRQRARIDPRFERLARVANDPTQILALREDPSSVAPERAIVFEVEGALDDFYAQARAINLEYLGDFEEEFDPTEDFYHKGKPDKPLTGRIYLAMPDVRALRELLSLWNRFSRGERMPMGKGAWSDLFSTLIDVRPWGPQDRIPQETILAWHEHLTTAPGEPVLCEVELWFHETAGRRSAAFDRVTAEIRGVGGRVVDHAVIAGINYDAVLADLPSQHVQTLISNPDVSLARADEVMFLRSQSVVRYAADEFAGADGTAPPEGPSFVSNEPIAALLDGLPVQNHVRLAGRLVVDDPEDLDASYPVDRREHGTEMASLIIHGDLSSSEAPIARPLHVRPVLQPSAGGDERTPPDKLLVDVIYQAVRRIKEGDGAESATAPKVAIINISLGDVNRPFARVMSPLARLLDYLAQRYQVLFLVSAGNIVDPLPIPGFRTWSAFEEAAPEERERAVLAALMANKSQRTLLSPAESINALTVGAAHEGSAFTGRLPNGRVDPLTDGTLPNIASAMGLGFKKVVKPELLFEGGRIPATVVESGDGLVVRPARIGAQHFGVKVARPSPIGGLRYEDYASGTSVATALATHAAHRIYEVLAANDGSSNHADMDPAYVPLVLKALLVHGAQWSEKGAYLDAFFSPQGRGAHLARRDDITRLLGYGVPRIDRILACAENQATLVGYGTITANSALLYRIPLPSGLDGVRAVRALTVTLAWFSPVNPRHHGYRMAALDVTAASEDKYWIASEREPYQPTDKAVVRGTVFHERRSGEAATVFTDDGNLLLRVSCRASAGNLTEAVPYALAVSFEVAIQAGIQVYDQVRARLTTSVRAGVRTGA